MKKLIIGTATALTAGGLAISLVMNGAPEVANTNAPVPSYLSDPPPFALSSAFEVQGQDPNLVLPGALQSNTVAIP